MANKLGNDYVNTEGSRANSITSESKMDIADLKRHVAPRITDSDVARMYDDGRPFPNNQINTK